jgi:hypothetical protein
MLKLKVFLLLLIVSATGKYLFSRNILNRLSNLSLILTISGIDGRARRKRRQMWPNVLAPLAPGGNTFAASGYYGMQSYIAYPQSGIAYNSNAQGWNPYWQGYYQQNQFNNYNRG